jgi:2-polyprenyl-3-methyl-5-hydroxy-6-metoxy-1,4-benzoquinol methylase
MIDIKEYAKNYIMEPFEYNMVRLRRKKVLEQISKYSHDTILEIGCGMSPLFLDIKECSRMIIVEPCKEFVNNAKELAQNYEMQIQVFEGYFEDQVDFIGNLGIDYDVIVLSGVLTEVDDPQRILRATRELCSHNTFVHVNVPNAESLHRLIAKEMGLIHDIHEESEQMIKQQRQRTYDIESLVKEVKYAGFIVEETGSYFMKPFTHHQMQMCIDSGIINEDVLEGLYKIVRLFPKHGAEIYVDLRI